MISNGFRVLRAEVVGGDGVVIILDKICCPVIRDFKARGCMTFGEIRPTPKIISGVAPHQSPDDLGLVFAVPEDMRQRTFGSSRGFVSVRSKAANIH